ncbi:MAG: Maf family protein [Candidatus Omnitrophica bacterium]|nr:Maf family protein [Candidatus Omnitrophota bacterium]
MNKPALILASASIGRKNLLEKLGVPFKVKASEINEDIISSNTYDGGVKDKFYFTSKAFLIQASGEISGTGGAKAKPILTVVVER